MLLSAFSFLIFQQLDVLNDKKWIVVAIPVNTQITAPKKYSIKSYFESAKLKKYLQTKITWQNFKKLKLDGKIFKKEQNIIIEQWCASIAFFGKGDLGGGS